MTFDKINYHSLTATLSQHQKTLRNIVVVLLSIYLLAFLARVIWQLVPTPASSVAPSTINTSVIADANAKGGVNVSRIQQLNLFGKKNEAPAKQVEQKVTDAPQTKLNLVLTGVVASSIVEQAAAIIEHKGSQMVYGLGEKIDSTNAILKQVETDRVIIKNGARHETLMLDGVDYEKGQKNSRTANNNRGRTLANSGAQRQIATNNNATQLNREAAEATSALREQPSDFTDFISIAPETADGQLVGYKVKPGKNPALFESAGLEAGDIIVQINGLSLTDTQQSMEAMNALRSAQNIELTLTRDGEYQTVYLDIPATGEE